MGLGILDCLGVVGVVEVSLATGIGDCCVVFTIVCDISVSDFDLGMDVNILFTISAEGDHSKACFCFTSGVSIWNIRLSCSSFIGTPDPLPLELLSILLVAMVLVTLATANGCAFVLSGCPLVVEVVLVVITRGEGKFGLGVVGEFSDGNEVKLLLYKEGVCGCIAVS